MNKHWWTAIGAYVLSAAGDWLTSMVGAHYDLAETNTFTRDSSFHFVLWKGIALDSAYGVLLALTLYLICSLAKVYSEKAATFIGCGTLSILTISRLWDAVFPNFLLIFKSIS